MLLGRGYTYSNEFIRAWMNSASKEDILSRNYKDIGVAVRAGKLTGEDTTVIVAFLANRQSVNGTVTKSTSVDCVGPDGKHFQTTQKSCDEFNAKWGNTKTSPVSNLPIQSKPSYPNYVTITCTTAYGVYTSYGKDYTEAQMYCNNLQQNAIKLQQNMPTYAPINVQPTSLPVSDNTEQCNDIRSEWQSFKENFMTNNYNNYSSSAEAIYALEVYRQGYQQAYNGADCYGALSLY